MCGGAVANVVERVSLISPIMASASGEGTAWCGSLGGGGVGSCGDVGSVAVSIASPGLLSVGTSGALDASVDGFSVVLGLADVCGRGTAADDTAALAGNECVEI